MLAMHRNRRGDAVDDLPAMVRPMLATSGPPPAGPGWSVEFKWDGIRAIVAAAPGGRVLVWSRNGNDVSASYPELAAGPTAEALGARGPVLLDGEIVALDAQGRPVFSRLTQRMHVRAPSAELVARFPVQLYVFDLPQPGPPYDERRAALAALELGAVPHVAVPPAYTDVPAAQLLDVARAHGLEGVVAKRRRSRYEPGRRSAAWVKTALTTTQEVVVGGWSPGHGRRAGMVGSLLMGAYDRAGRLRYLGQVGTGFTDAALRQLGSLLAPLAVASSPFDDEVPVADARATRWVRPELVGEVVYRVLTPDLRLRHTSWRGLRPDRDPAEIVLDLPRP
jgi:bifunctional non-homologous end joining protein LigD